MNRILVISDTHLQIFSELPAALVKIAATSDLIVHAGDICTMNVLKGLREINSVIAVQGNMDEPEVKDILPVEERFEVGGVHFGITHGVGLPEKVADNVEKLFDNVDVLIFGHSHLPYNERRNDCTLFNPGSSIDPRSAIIPTYGIIKVENGNADLYIHQLTDE